MRKIEIEIGGQWVENPVAYLPGVVGTITLLDDKAPQICDALWNALPLETRTIHAFNAGQTWRTEKNFKLVADDMAENASESLEPGRHRVFELPKNTVVQDILRLRKRQGADGGQGTHVHHRQGR